MLITVASTYVYVLGRNPFAESFSTYLLQQFYATTRRLPLHALLEDHIYSSDVPHLRAALHLNVLGTDDVVEIIEFLVERNPALLSSRDQDDSLPLRVTCRGVSFTVVQSLVNCNKASIKSVRCEMPTTSLDTVFLLIHFYPDLVCR
jgi:hypothetical protein